MTKKDAIILDRILSWPPHIEDKSELGCFVSTITNFAFKEEGMHPELAKQYLQILCDYEPALYVKKGVGAGDLGDVYYRTWYAPYFIKDGGFMKVYRKGVWDKIWNILPKWAPIVISLAALVVAILSFIYKVS